MSQLTDWSDQPKIEQLYKFNCLELKQLWEAISQLNGYLFEDPEQETLDFSHPLMNIQFTIQGQLDTLIEVGMKSGLIVWPLLDIKTLLNEAADGV